MESIDEKIEQYFNQALEWLSAKRPALESVIRPFTAILLQREKLITAIQFSMPPLNSNHINDQLYAGIPVINAISTDTVNSPMRQVLIGLMPVLKTSFPQLREILNAVDAKVQKDGYDLGTLARAYLEENIDLFQAVAQKNGDSMEVLVFAIFWTISAVFNAVRKNCGESKRLTQWSKSYCPICGSLPSISFIADHRADEADSYGGKGGEKYLHCALCGQQWRTRRNRCPACDNDENEDLFYYHATNDNSERIDACKKCGHYLLCADLRLWDLVPPMDMAALAMIHLDLIAREKGYLPITWTPWNRIDAA